MTPKEKAKELYLKYTNTLNIRDLQITANPFAKQCALIAVHEIIASNPIAFDEYDNCIEKNWWKEVKKEIEKL